MNKFDYIPKLGFGLMRLPMIGEAVDIEQTKKMADEFLSRGFKYFDTAYGYIGGLSEKAVKPVLSDRYAREDFILASKLSIWCVKDFDFEAYFNEQLERTGVSYFDFYLVHSLEREKIALCEEKGVWDFVSGLKERGLIKHLGFSFHDNAEVLDKLLTAHPEVEFVQLQLNYNDWESEGVQSRLCYETARKHGKGVIVMEPVKGGALALLPEEAQKVLKGIRPNDSVASWAIRYAASLDGVITVLSGMSDYAQMQDNLKTMSDFQPITDEEKAALDEVNRILKSMPTVPCTNCQYCMDNCPMGIPIPRIIRGAYNGFKTYANVLTSKRSYGFAVEGKVKASECLQCGLCEANCPQKIGIIDILKESAELFE